MIENAPAFGQLPLASSMDSEPMPPKELRDIPNLMLSHSSNQDLNFTLLLQVDIRAS
jgi:hypothetical protein